MSLRYFIHILFKRKWYILTALLAAPLIALAFLLFVEPVYVSRCKLEVHDRSSDADPLAPRRSNVKDDIFIQAQIELIFTDQVLGQVVDKAGLVPEPPSQCLLARFTGHQPPPSKLSPERQRIEAIRALKKRITVEAITPVVFTITAQMNTPELAQKVSSGIYEAYVEEFDRHRGEDTQFKQFYDQRLRTLDSARQQALKEMEDFRREHPRLNGNGPDTLTVPDKVAPLIPDSPKQSGENFSQRASENNPVQTLQNEIAKLELEAIDIEKGNSKDSFAYRSIQERIAKGRALLDKYKKELTEPEVINLQYSGLQWKLETRQQSYQKVDDEYQKVLTSILTKSKSQGTISVLDHPTFDPQPILPKKTLILIAAAFVGLVLGLGMGYIAHVLDSTYHLPEDFAADTGLPVLAAIPYDRNLAISEPGVPA